MAVAQENVPNRPVHATYITGGVLLFYLLQWTLQWIWGYFDRAPSGLAIRLIAGVTTLIAGVYLYRNDRVRTLVAEVATELKKVTWPTSKETKAAVIITVVMTIISAGLLGLFDMVWSQLTSLIYG